MTTETASTDSTIAQSPIRVAVIVGSVRDGRFGPVVAEWFATQARQRPELDVDVIDLADVDLPVRLTDNPAPEVAAVLADVTGRLTEAQAFVVVTPEYNHSFPASLKNLIDWHLTQWQAKPIGFVSYGGLAGGLRAVEHLRQVFAELHAVTLRDTVSFYRFWEAFDGDGRPKDAVACNGAAELMLDRLVWWASALTEARSRRPYGDQ